MQIKTITKKLPNGFVDVHNQAFKGFFLTSLGDKFLNLYYNSVMKSDDGLVVCLLDENENTLGFAAGTKHSKGFHKKILKKNLFSYIRILFIVLITRPKAIFRLFKNLNKKVEGAEDDGNYAELLSIAVPPEHNGKGYGKKLLFAFEDELKNSNVRKIALTTDFYDNESVLAFYKKTGYDIFYEFTAFPDRKMYKMIKNMV